MFRIEKTYNQIIKYLKELLSNRERHDLEKEMMQDIFKEEAFEGLSRLTFDELETDMEKLTSRLNNRIDDRSTRSLNWFYRIAAAIILLIGISGTLFLIIKKPTDKLITQKTEQPIIQNPDKSKPLEVPETETPAMKEKTNQYKIENEPESEKAYSEEILTYDTILPLSDIQAAEPEFSYLKDETKPELNIAEISPSTTESIKAAAGAPAIAKKNKDEVLRIRGVSSIQSPGLLSGKVLDSQGQPLPGVTVQIKGSNIGTVTDLQGNFSLNSQDPNSEIALNFIGYIPLEIKGSELQGKEIRMAEDVMALDEVVVVGYGTNRESDLISSVYDINSPTPPEGTLRKFKLWVEKRLNFELFKELSGEYKIKVNLLVNTDGTISNIKINEDIPETISKEYLRIISESPVWKPAVKNNEPVATEVKITFSLTLKE